MIDKLNNKYMILFDCILALAIIAYALYSFNYEGYSHSSLIMIISGILGCVMAYYRPTKLMKGFLKKSLVKRS
jgi:hypothetical protein